MSTCYSPYATVTHLFLLQYLSYYLDFHFFDGASSILLQWLIYFLDYVRHFWDFVVHYSKSVIFCYNDLAIFVTVTQTFLDFIGHFLDFVACYNDSIIFVTVTQSFFLFYHPFLDFIHALQWLNYFAIVTQSFWDFISHFLWFRQPFFRFCCAQQCSTIFFYSDSTIFWFRYAAL
jgi:hypothetical protein